VEFPTKLSVTLHTSGAPFICATWNYKSQLRTLELSSLTYLTQRQPELGKPTTHRRARQTGILNPSMEQSSLELPNPFSTAVPKEIRIPPPTQCCGSGTK